ncbi:MAG TPA: hypothetical protein VHB21_12020, partial [Minicystis sp.]|nr:hypothetical protein [Minicystis sp.]
SPRRFCGEAFRRGFLHAAFFGMLAAVGRSRRNRALARRAAALAGLALLVACGARSELARPDVGAGGAGGAGCPAPSMVVTATVGGDIEHQYLECVAWPEDEACPGPDQAKGLVTLHCPPAAEASVDCGPERRGASCCYLMTEVCALT